MEQTDNTVVPHYLWDICSKTPQWMPGTTDSTKPQTVCFSYTYIPKIKFNL